MTSAFFEFAKNLREAVQAIYRESKGIQMDQRLEIVYRGWCDLPVAVGIRCRQDVGRSLAALAGALHRVGGASRLSLVTPAWSRPMTSVTHPGKLNSFH